MNINWTNPIWSASLFVIYIITSCFGLYLIKAAAGWKTSAFVIGFVLYGSGAVIWMVILRLMPLSFAFPIAAAPYDWHNADRSFLSKRNNYRLANCRSIYDNNGHRINNH